MSQTVLVVDDEQDVIDLVSYHLRASGYVVETAIDGKEALNKARAVLPDLIILDRMLPELDGMTVLQILRCLPSTGTIPILMLTANGSDVAKINALHWGVDDYVTKPFSPRNLMTRVRQLIETRSGEQVTEVNTAQ